MQELFRIIETYGDREYTLKIIFIEIYNEQIRDLISENQ